MLEKKSILLIYAEGMYDSSILATKEYIESTNADCYVIAISDKELRSFKSAQIKRWIYTNCIRNWPFMHGLLFTLSRINTRHKINSTKHELKEYKIPEEAVSKWFYKITEKYRRVYNIIRRFAPDVILCADPSLLNKVCKAVHNAKLINTTITALITDYVLDERFVNYRVDKFYVQNQGVLGKLRSYGIDSEKLEIIGTPISEKSIKSQDISEIRKEFGIANNNPNIVIIGGRYGSSKIKDAFTAMMELNTDINIVVYTTNSVSLNKFCAVLAKSKQKEKTTFLVEYLDDISKLYALADIIITCPTASITYEIMCINRGMILCKGSNRIEKQNAHYLISNGCALSGQSIDELIASLGLLLGNDEHLMETFANQNAIVSTNDIVNLSDSLLEIATTNYNKKKELYAKRNKVANLSKKQDTKLTKPNDDNEIMQEDKENEL